MKVFLKLYFGMTYMPAFIKKVFCRILLNYANCYDTEHHFMKGSEWMSEVFMLLILTSGIRGCVGVLNWWRSKTVTCQSWYSNTNLGHQPVCLVKKGSNTPTKEFVFDIQLSKITVLQPLKLWWWKVVHLKALSHIYLCLALKSA